MAIINTKDTTEGSSPYRVTGTKIGDKRALDVNVADGDITLNPPGLSETPTYNVVSVDDEATLLTSLSGRKKVVVRNADEQDVQMCEADGDVGLTLEPGDKIEYDMATPVSLYAITESGTANVEVEETK